MQLSETVKLYLSKEQKDLLVRTMNEYIHTVNRLVSLSVNGTSISKFTSADVVADLPSAMKNQCIRDAKSVVNKYNKAVRNAERLKKKAEKKKSDVVIREPKVSVLRKPCCFVNNQNFKIDGDYICFPVLVDGKSKRPCCFVNNQNFKIDGDYICFPVLVDGKSKRISVSTAMTDKQKQIFSNAKLGTMRIVFKGNKIVAQIVYEAVEPEQSDEGNVMGVDLGIKCPAVSYSSERSFRRQSI